MDAHDASDAYSLDKNGLCQNVEALNGKKVLIIGDVMLDIYLQGDAKRISPEAPVPVVHIASQKNMPGGAANVARNIRALGGLPTLVGLCGSDSDGQVLVRLLQESYIAAHIFQHHERTTTVKTRIMAQNQQMLRVDKEVYLPANTDENRELCHALDALLPMHDVILISDYAKGLLSAKLMQHIHDTCAKLESPPEIFVDPKPQHAAIYGNVSLMTPNRNEAQAMAHISLNSQDDIIRAGQVILDTFHCKELLMTLGSGGMALFMENGHIYNIATHARAVFDVTGAGDTVIACLALARAAKIPLVAAAHMATYAAGLVLEHVGVACVNAEDILKAIHESSRIPLCTRWK